MPRDGAGNYILPAGNPVVSGTVITPTWANPTMDDIAFEMTDSLSRSGKGGMLVPFLNQDGTEGAPGITWIGEPSTGFFREGSSDMRAAVGGVVKTRWIAGDLGFEVWDGTAFQKPAYAGADQTITGAWTFTKEVATGVYPITISGTAPFQQFIQTGAVADEKNWRWGATAGAFFFQSRTDIDGGGTNWLTVNRSGATVSDATFGVTVIVPNNVSFGGRDSGNTVNVRLAKINASDQFELGASNVNGFFDAFSNLVTRIGDVTVADFVSRANGSLQISDSAGVLSNAMRLGGNKQTITNSTTLANDNFFFGDISTGGETRVIGMTAADKVQVGQSSSVVTGMDLFSGEASTEFQFMVSTAVVAKIDNVGFLCPLDKRLSFTDTLGDVKAGIFFQNDLDMRVGGTDNPNASMRCGFAGEINNVIGNVTTLSVQTNRAICKSNLVGQVAADFFIQFQDANGLNNGQIGNPAGADELRIQGQGGQDIRLEALAVTFNVIGTSAVAANAVFIDANNSIKVSTSARKYKRDIVPIAKKVMERVLGMNPVRYRSRAKGDDPNMEFYGLTAEDVHAVDPRLVHMRNGKPDGVQYDRVAVLLLGVVQDMAKRLKVLENA